METQSHLGYREILRHEYAIRHEKNPAFSLRAFARQIGISVSFLSELMHDKKRLSLDKAKVICERLCLDLVAAQCFLHSVHRDLLSAHTAKDGINLNHGQEN